MSGSSDSSFNSAPRAQQTTVTGRSPAAGGGARPPATALARALAAVEADGALLFERLVWAGCTRRDAQALLLAAAEILSRSGLECLQPGALARAADDAKALLALRRGTAAGLAPRLNGPRSAAVILSIQGDQGRDRTGVRFVRAVRALDAAAGVLLVRLAALERHAIWRAPLAGAPEGFLPPSEALFRLARFWIQRRFPAPRLLPDKRDRTAPLLCAVSALALSPFGPAVGALRLEARGPAEAGSIGRIYLLPQALARALLTSGLIAAGENEGGKFWIPGAAAGGGKLRQRSIVRRLARELCDALLGSGAAQARTRICDPLSEAEAARSIAAAAALRMHARWSARWAAAREEALLHAPEGVPAPPVFERIASDPVSRPRRELHVLGHRLALPDMSEATALHFARALADIERAVRINPGLEDFYLLRLPMNDFPRSKGSARVLLTALFVECARLADAALWAPALSGAGVLLCAGGSGPDNWVTHRTEPALGKPAAGYVLALDMPPQQPFLGEKERSAHQLTVDLARFVWLSSLRKMLLGAASPAAAIVAPDEQMARAAARFPTLTRPVLTAESEIAMREWLPQGVIDRARKLPALDLLLENIALKAGQQGPGNPGAPGRPDFGAPPRSLARRLQPRGVRHPWRRRPF